MLAGDFLKPIEDIQTCFSRLSQRIQNVIVLQVLDPSELTLDFSGRVRFSGPHFDLYRISEEEVIDSVSDIRASYIKRLQNHIAQLEQLCASHGWVYALHVTQNDPAEILSGIWTMLDEKRMHG